MPVTNLYRDEILDGAELPMAFCRLHASASAARQVRRAKTRAAFFASHEFDKVELVRYATPETSAEQLELLTRHAETMLERLGIPYRVKLLAAGDTGCSARRRTI